MNFDEKMKEQGKIIGIIQGKTQVAEEFSWEGKESRTLRSRFKDGWKVNNIGRGRSV